VQCVSKSRACCFQLVNWLRLNFRHWHRCGLVLWSWHNTCPTLRSESLVLMSIWQLKSRYTYLRQSSISGVGTFVVVVVVNLWPRPLVDSSLVSIQTQSLALRALRLDGNRASVRVCSDSMCSSQVLNDGLFLVYLRYVTREFRLMLNVRSVASRTIPCRRCILVCSVWRILSQSTSSARQADDARGAGEGTV